MAGLGLTLHPVRQRLVLVLTVAIAVLLTASVTALAFTRPNAGSEANRTPTTDRSPAAGGQAPEEGAPPASVPPDAATPPSTAEEAGEAARPVLVRSPKGVILPVVRQEGADWVVRTPCQNTATTPGVVVPPPTVILDAGHGGGDSGAIGPNGLKEKDVNLAVTRATETALVSAGVPVLLTRTGDFRMTLSARTAVVNAAKPRAFVSIHHNAVPDGPLDRPGAETYYQIGSADSKRLSGLIYEEVVRALTPYRLAWVGDTDAGAKYRPNSRGGDYYGIIRGAAGTPSVLAELAFVSSPPEAELLARPDVRNVLGESVARGILRWLNTKDPGSGYTIPYPRGTPAGPGGGRDGCVDPPL